MDNKPPEINPPPENIEIPEDWQFPERDKPGLKVAQIDLDQRFLAFTLPDNPRAKGWPGYQGEYGDYFFTSEGKPSEYRKRIFTVSSGIA